MKAQRGIIEIYLAGALLLVCAACVILYQREAAAEKELARAEAALQNVARNGKTEVKYVEKIVSVPGRTVIRDRLNAGMCQPAGVPGQPDAHGATSANSADRLPDSAGGFEEQLSAELRAVAINQAKLDAIHAELKPQVSQ